MNIVEEKKGKATLFHLSGRLDSANSSEVEQKILNSMDQGSKEVILNFEGLDYISSAGIRVLVHCHKEIEKNGGHIYLAAQPKPIEISSTSLASYPTLKCSIQPPKLSMQSIRIEEKQVSAYDRASMILTT